MNEKKLTKKEKYEMIKEMVKDNEMLLTFVEDQIKAIDTKAEKAKAKNAEKKAAGDELKDKIKAVLTNEAETIDNIIEKLDVEGITKAKVVARLTALYKEGVAERTEVSVDGKKLKAYSLIG